MTNIDVTDVPETDAEVEAKLDAVKLDTPKVEVEEKAEEKADTPTTPVVPTPRGNSNSAYADEVTRAQVEQMMLKLKEAGYVRPELIELTGFNDSTVWRAQNRKVHTVELDTWMALFARFANGELVKTNPPKASLRKPKVEDLLVKLADTEAAFTARIEAAVKLLAGDAKTTAQYKKLVAEATAALQDA